MKPTIWARNQNNLQPESDIKVWLNFSYYQGKISGTEMVHLFLYISPLVTKHYKTIIPPKTNIDTKMMVSKSPFPGGPQFQVPAVKFSCSFCMFDSRGIGSLFLGTNFEFFISVLLLVRRVWLVVFGYGGLKIDNISISHEFSFFWAVPTQKNWRSMVSKWLVVCFQCNIFLLFLSLFIYIYYILVELTPSSYEVDPTSYKWGLSPVFCRVKSPQLPWVEFTLLGTNPYPPCPSPAPVESMIFRTFRSDMYPLPGVSKGRSSPSIWDTIGLLNPCCARSIWFWWQRSCSIMAWETWHTNRSSRLVYIGVEWSLSPCSFCTRRLRVNSTIFYRSTLPKNHWTFQWRGLNLYSRGVLVPQTSWFSGSRKAVTTGLLSRFILRVPVNQDPSCATC